MFSRSKIDRSGAWWRLPVAAAFAFTACTSPSGGGGEDAVPDVVVIEVVPELPAPLPDLVETRIEVVPEVEIVDITLDEMSPEEKWGFAVLCMPCNSDTDCDPLEGGHGARCVDPGPGGGVCATPCDNGQPCPEDFACDDWPVMGGSSALVCRQEPCPCPDIAVTSAAAASCFQENTHGTCTGELTCEKAGSPSICDAPTPVAEYCDGEDNNCDGETDEGLGDATCGLGPCEHTESVCVDGVKQQCDSFLGALSEECNGIDDNCDGETDEDFPDLDKDGLADCIDEDIDGDGAPDATDNCLVIPNSLQEDFDEDGAGDACDDDDDDDGTVDLADCEPLNPAVYPQAEETCDGIDEDCDELVDEGLGTTTCGLGECAHTVDNCSMAQLQECDPYEGMAADTCDGLDNDCDGLVDEDLGETTCGTGQCEKTVANCVEGETQLCDPDSGGSSEDCDGVDNDCDGLIDEDFDLTMLPDHCGACGVICKNFSGTTSCIDGRCRPLCDEGWGDCDNDLANGCEEKLVPGKECGPCYVDDECAAGHCKKGFDDVGGWCAFADQCVHSGVIYESGQVAEECFDSSAEAHCEGGEWIVDDCGEETACTNFFCLSGACHTSDYPTLVKCGQALLCSSAPGDDGYGTGGDHLCAGFCDGQGSCDYAGDCVACSDVDGWKETGDQGPGCGEVLDTVGQLLDYICVDGACVADQTATLDCNGDDGFYGGGDIAGCGSDPASEFRDFFVLDTGECEYTQVGCETVWCDDQDECQPVCDGTDVRAWLDFFVEESGDVCLFTQGEVLEECDSLESTESDGGPEAYFEGGTVVDYGGCADGACTFVELEDSCEGALLQEYGADGVGHTGPLTHDCLSHEAHYCLDPQFLYLNTWTCEGTPGFCTETPPDVVAEDCGLDDCEGECGSDPGCQWVERGCLEAECYATFHEPDESADFCSACQLSWELDEGEGTCCGDDEHEFVRECADESDNGECGEDVASCCSEPEDCVDHAGTCASNGDCTPFGTGGAMSFCAAGVWKDPDEAAEYCEAAGCGYSWLNTLCCGDDAGEDHATGAEGGKCCYEGEMLESGGTAASVLCLDGLLYDCNDLAVDDSDLGIAVVNCEVRGGLYCGADGVWLEGMENGCGCASDEACLAGFCRDGVCCDADCLSPCMDCSTGQCLSVVAADDDPECMGDYSCNADGLCLKKTGLTCDLAEECGSGFCADGSCCDSACLDPCLNCATGTCAAVADEEDLPECMGDFSCNGDGICLKKTGLTCDLDQDCVSGHCKDGACCQTACAGSCFECSTGTCNAVLGMEDPPECEGDFACDDIGACRRKEGLACTVDSQCLSTWCVDGACCESECTTPCFFCGTGSCEAVAGADDDPECSGDSSCGPQGECLLHDGQGCSEGPECLSGYCTDDHCCNQECASPCFSCATGSCIAVTGSDDLPECTGTTTCDDAGQCRLKDGEACAGDDQCASANCATDHEGEGRWCVGDGQCVHAGVLASEGDYSAACLDTESRALCTAGLWTADACDEDACAPLCGIVPGACLFVLRTCSDGQCVEDEVDTDIEQQYCAGCDFDWALGGEVAATDCCGDDTGEFAIDCDDASDNGDCGEDTWACCNSSSDCVDHAGVCQWAGACSLFGTQSKLSYCNFGEWTDPDDQSSFCTACTGSPVWAVGGEVAAQSCCGDDSGENLRTCVDSSNTGACGVDHTACCSGVQSCVDAQGECRDQDTCHLFGSETSVSLCTAGSWESPDESESYCLACEYDWALGGDAAATQCCGDDPFENVRTCADSSTNGNCGSDGTACCAAQDACVDEGGGCRAEGLCHLFGTLGRKSYCAQGTWQDPDESVDFCTAGGCGYTWLSMAPSNRCCGDDPSEDTELPGVGNSCCYNGSALASGTSSGSLLCYDGELHECNDGAGDDSGMGEEHSTCEGIGGYYCTSANTWIYKLPAGCECTSNTQCSSGQCKSDYDGDGKWCSASSFCVHDGILYGSGTYSTDCYSETQKMRCNSGYWSAQSCGLDACAGDCGTMDNGCVYQLHRCVDGDCQTQPQDTDLTSQYCTGCSQAWAQGGETAAQECCGDDEEEFALTCSDSSTNGNCGTDKYACCDVDSDCVDHLGECVDQGACFEFGAGAKVSYCEDGTWQDPDEGEVNCTSQGCEFAWAVGGEAAPTSCCGDDNNEILRECTDSAENGDCGTDVQACCTANDCVDHAGTCRNTGACYYFGSGGKEAYCFDGAWEDPDEGETYCLSCTGTSRWSLGGDADPDSCCGDDDGEYRRTCTDSSVNGNCGADKTACCDSNVDCVDHVDGCHETGICGTFGADNLKSYCSNGTWQDPDESVAYCAAAGCLYQWQIGGESDPNTCCGDDADEFSRTCNDGSANGSCGTDQLACCNAGTDCVDHDGLCRDEDQCHGFGTGGRLSYCGSGTWRDPDTASSYCEADGCGFAWLTTASTNRCCGDEDGEDNEQPGAGTECCYNASILSGGSWSGSVLCHSGFLYDCNGIATDDSALATHVTTCSMLGDAYCKSSNTWSLTPPGGCP